MLHLSYLKQMNSQPIRLSHELIFYKQSQRLGIFFTEILQNLLLAQVSNLPPSNPDFLGLLQNSLLSDEKKLN